MDLKIAAARRRKSVAAVVREKLGVKNIVVDKRIFWKELNKFARETAKMYPGLSLSQKLIEMRYEQ